VSSGPGEASKELYIVSGPLGPGGVGRNWHKDTIGGGKVVVPKYTWRVILVVRRGAKDPAKVKGASASSR
jgi:hypothetical protein